MKLKITKNNFATFMENGIEIEMLSGIFCSNQSEVNKLQSIVNEVNENSRLRADRADALKILKRIRQWDQFPDFSDKFGDGNYWMREVEALIKRLEAE